MRVLGLDYGSARCGCAVSDPTGTLVTPLATVVRPGGRRGLDALVALVAEREVQRVVVGLPLALDGHDSEQTRETRRFAARLARRLGDRVPVELHDERFTTRLAQRDVLFEGGSGRTHDRGAGGDRRTAHAHDRTADGNRRAGRTVGVAAPEDSRAAAHMLESWLAARNRNDSTAANL